jgi:hypothetical protein
MHTMCNKAPEVAADDAVPGWSLSLVERFLDVLGDVLLPLACQYRQRMQIFVYLFNGELGHGFLSWFLNVSLDSVWAYLDCFSNSRTHQLQ